MTPQEAEAEIVSLVKMVDRARELGIPTDVIEQRIRELKQITGPRGAAGTAHITMPRLSNASSQ